MDGRAGYQVGLRQLAQALTVLPVAVDGGPIQDQSLPSDMPALELGPPHAGAHPLDDQAAFEFGDGADDDDKNAAQRSACIDVFPEADVLDAHSTPTSAALPWISTCVPWAETTLREELRLSLGNRRQIQIA